MVPMEHSCHVSQWRHMFHGTVWHVAGCLVNLALTQLIPVPFPSWCVENIHTTHPHSVTHIHTPPWEQHVTSQDLGSSASMGHSPGCIALHSPLVPSAVLILQLPSLLHHQQPFWARLVLWDSRRGHVTPSSSRRRLSPGPLADMPGR